MYRQYTLHIGWHATAQALMSTQALPYPIHSESELHVAVNLILVGCSTIPRYHCQCALRVATVLLSCASNCCLRSFESISYLICLFATPTMRARLLVPKIKRLAKDKVSILRLRGQMHKQWQGRIIGCIQKCRNCCYHWQFISSDSLLQTDHI